MKKWPILLSALIIAACNNGKIQIPIDADLPFKDFISAYSSGLISNSSELELVTRKPIVLTESKDIEACIDITPTFDFSTEIIHNNRLIVKPTTTLKSGTRYQVKVNINKLLDQDLSESEFPMVVETFNQAYYLTELQASVYNASLPNEVTISGLVKTNDATTLKKVYPIIRELGDIPLGRIKWSQKSYRSFAFEVSGFTKKEKAQTIEIKTNGKSIGQKDNRSFAVVIPAKNLFKVNDWSYKSYPDQCFMLQFSEVLKAKQDLTGLIEIEHFSKPKFVIDGSQVLVFVNSSYAGTSKLKIHPGIKGKFKLKTKAQEFDVVIDEPTPTVEIIGKGTILPNSQGLIIPFKTIGLKKVNVEVFQIFENNILQFLQINTIDERSRLKRVAKRIKTKTISLEKGNKNRLKSWQTHGLNLAEVIKPQPGAIYRVRFSFRQDYTFNECVKEIEFDQSYADYYENSDVRSIERTDQCNPYFYYYSSKAKNILASDLGIVVKTADHLNYTVAATNLISGKEQPKTTFQFYNYQQQLIGTVNTRKEAIASIKLEEEPFVVIANHGKHKAYKKLANGYNNSFSKFETGGVKRGDGIDGYFYGERGVWRPGDKIHLSFVLRDEFDAVSEGMPLTLELFNPKDQRVVKQKGRLTKKGINAFTLATNPDAATGNYTAKLTAGSHSFSHTVKVESIRPNRLKIHLASAEDNLVGYKTQNIQLHGEWLHGALAKNLKATTTMVLSPKHTHFKAFKAYNFNDQTKSYMQSESVIFNDTLNKLGDATIQIAPQKIRSSGILRASLVTKIFEKGGGFSIDNKVYNFHPYSSYVGMKINKSKYGYLTTETNNPISLVSVSNDGRVSNKADTIQLKAYRVDWRWWWQHNDEDLGSYFSMNNHLLISDTTIILTSGKAKHNFNISQEDWGQYYIQAVSSSGHSTGEMVFVDYPNSTRNLDQQNNALLLTMRSDKEKYTANETARVTIPSPAAGKALVSIENDIEVIKTFWVNTSKGNTSFDVSLNAKMSPNCYVHVTLLQEHVHDENDMPIRMYGILPLTVYDKETILTPTIAINDVIKPNKQAYVTVSEENKRGMYYTVAIVDEGLLDLTRFRTPRIWNHFNKKRGLGVKTWDIYGDVVNSFSGKFDNVYSIGGDGAGRGGNIAKAQRFKPTVKFLGPFYLKPGEKANHKFSIRDYVGSVRIMVVARNKNSFGHADKTAKVKKALMVQANAPRVLTPKDEVVLPITIFATDKAKLPITVAVTTNDMLSITKKKYTISKIENGEHMIFINSKVSDKLGNAKFDVKVFCDNDAHSTTINLAVRLPGYQVTEVTDTILQPGQSANLVFNQIGFEGTESAVLEVSQFPSINLKKRLDYLIQYPHGCIEQTTSSVFPQLYLDQIMKLPEKQKNQIDKNINKGIKRIQRFLTMDGGFAYWPGNSNASEWGTNYAGHFLLEAKSKGYYVPDFLLAKWHSYQQKQANAWSYNTGRYGNSNQLIQAYRLYLLALHGKPEIANMNRLKEGGITNHTARLRLASAYAILGQNAAAKQLMKGARYNFPFYREHHYTFGSRTRDIAISIECLNELKNTLQLPKQMIKLAKVLGSNSWLSTQETAYSLCAYAKVIGNENTRKANYTYTINSMSKQTASFNEALAQHPIKSVKTTNKVAVANSGNQVLFVRLINRGTPLTTTLTNKQKGLNMNVSYFSSDGSNCSIDSMQFGEDYTVQISVKNMSPDEHLNNLALSTYIPAGCELQNTRLIDGASNNVDYEDIKDDVVYAYFDLPSLSTKKISYTFTASYKGKFIHPGIHCEAMYDASIFALKKGKHVEVLE